LGEVSNCFPQQIYFNADVPAPCERLSHGTSTTAFHCGAGRSSGARGKVWRVASARARFRLWWYFQDANFNLRHINNQSPNTTLSAG
jgi:hypothetical protein